MAFVTIRSATLSGAGSGRRFFRVVSSGACRHVHCSLQGRIPNPSADVTKRSRDCRSMAAAVAVGSAPATTEVGQVKQEKLGQSVSRRARLGDGGVAIKTPYEELCEKLREVSCLEGISGLLGWDEMVMMPDGAAGSRAAQKAALAGISFDKQTDPRIGELLKELESVKFDDPYQAAVVREARRNYNKLTRVPKALVKRKAELESEGYQAWVEARTSKDFSKFQPYLQEWVELVRKMCKAVDPDRPIYDVALDDYEKGLTGERLDQVFSQVREGLVPLLKEIREKGTPPDATVLNGKFDKKEQAALAEEIAKDLGFDLTKGRLDVSVHPFTGGAGPTDVRMTTRFKEEDLTEGLTGAIHETGHALYEQGRNLAYDGLPVNVAHGMGVHESQSLLWERMVALGRPFNTYLLPKLADRFTQLPKDLTAEQLYAAVNIVKRPSMIRVEADEVTYPLHIILRYDLERALLEGKIDVADLPARWNERMESDLGCKPEDDSRGVMQDVHWSAGLFGYFPTYSLGAMYACQIYQAAEKELPGLADDLAQGKFSRLKSWLNEKIHSKGSLYTSGDELLEAVTGSPLDPSVFLAHLKKKYSELYKL